VSSSPFLFSGISWKNREKADLTDDSDHAQLFIMSTFLFNIDPEGLSLTAASHFRPGGLEAFERLFPRYAGENRTNHPRFCTYIISPSWDKADAHKKPHRIAATNIYKTKDARFYHIHGMRTPG
jgi:hypothetical protein